MNKRHCSILASLFFATWAMIAQEKTDSKITKGHTNTNKFKQLKDEFSTPNSQHTASGAPGVNYTQQQVDYDMDIVLDEDRQILSGYEKITYHNNSEDPLEYLWLQLDQNKRAKDSKSPDIEPDIIQPLYTPKAFAKKFLEEPFDGGYRIEKVQQPNGDELPYTINRTMMRIDLPKPLVSGKTFEFEIQWWYRINNYLEDRGRSGYEHFEEDGNKVYVIAQFFPRLAVYDNVEGWQNMQFWGRSEFALEFGNYKVNITTPKDHILNATGILKNPKNVLTKKQFKRWKAAKNAFQKPVWIVTQEEAEIAEKKRSKEQKTWRFYAKNVRDFAFASSRKFIWDAMAVDINGRNVMAYSLYPKEGNPLWEEYSTKVVAHTLKEYSKYTFDYPYHKAISVHAKNQGMEYPQICWNYGRPREDGTYSKRTRDAMIGVITHEIGHNFFPMIVNSDERQWTWMDEGLNSFVETLTELAFDENFNTRNLPKDIVPYMAGDQSNLAPIMTQGDQIYQFGPNAYSKPAAGLYLLRKTILGPVLFDYAFRTYSRRWMFKHPTPEDFFRSMEDASGTDLDWFWRGWFYTTDFCDIGLKEVKTHRITDKPTEKVRAMAKELGIPIENIRPGLFFSEDSTAVDTPKNIGELPLLKNYLNNAYKNKEVPELPKYFYELIFEKPGGLVMPIILEITYEDGRRERKTYPAQIWRKNENEVRKIIASVQGIKSIVIDPDLETADVELSNNRWPKRTKSVFDLKKENFSNQP